MLVSALFACDDKETTEDIPLTGINNVTLNVGQSAFSRGVNGQKEQANTLFWALGNSTSSIVVIPAFSTPTDTC